MSRAYYNEIDPFAAQWLRNLIAAGLIAPGDVDERDIRDVRATDLVGYTQCHFFAGIGGWSYALRLAGWPDRRPVWTGSCPCQRHSSAARGRNVAPDLWPPMRELLRAGCPDAFFGEQVVAARAWLDGVRADVEGMGRAFRATVLPAYGAAFNHARERIFFASYADSHSESVVSVDAEVAGVSRGLGGARGLLPTHGVSASVARVRAGFGNAIVPQLAAAFIEACEDVMRQERAA